MMKISGHLPDVLLGAQWTPMTAPNQPFECAVVLNPWDMAGAEAKGQQTDSLMSPEEFWSRHGVPQDMLDRIVQWLTRSGLAAHHDGLVVWLSGSYLAVSQTFGFRFLTRSDDSHVYFRPDSEPEVPEWMAPWIQGVVGLDNCARLWPRYRHPVDTEQLANQGQGFFPSDIQTAYNFPANLDGSGVTIGLLEFSNGYSAGDIQAFWGAFNVSRSSPNFVSVDGTPNDGGANPWDMECTLDVEWAGAMAPGANLVVYEAAGGQSDRSFGLSVLKSLHYAINDTVNKPTVLSISYGDGETRFPQAVMRSWNTIMFQGAMTGITTFVSSGDQGAYGLQTPGPKRPHVDAPTNCPHAVSVGGTHLILNGNGTILEETGWSDTNNNGASGGGISQVFAVPGYQKDLVLPVKPGDHPGRGVPDVALNADPDTGYAVVFQGNQTVVGGTSASAPVWAALCAILNQARQAHGKGPIGYMNPHIYDLGSSPVFHDITIGNNSYNGVNGYSCTPGWDAVTGWGSPDAGKLIAELS